MESGAEFGCTSRLQWSTNATNLTNSDKAACDHSLNISLHWQISIDVDARSRTKRWGWDDLSSNPDRGVLKLLQAPRRWMPDELSFVCIELESVELHPAHEVICTYCDTSCKVTHLGGRAADINLRVISKKMRRGRDARWASLHLDTNFSGSEFQSRITRTEKKESVLLFIIVANLRNIKYYGGFLF